MNFSAAAIRLTKSMTLVSVVLLWSLGFVGPKGLYAEEERRGPVDWLILVDTSQSMIGRGPGAHDIFGNVKSTLKEFIATNSKLGDYVRLYSFDEKTPPLVPVVDSPIINDTTRKAAEDAVDHLVANGRYTHTGEAIRSALDRAAELQKLSELEKTYRQPVIVLLTDGLEDIRPRSGARSLDTLGVNAKELRPYLFVVWLGSRENLQGTPLERAVEKNFGERGRILEHPEGREMQRIIDQIREAILPPVFLRPQHIDFGKIENGSQSKGQQLTVESSRNTSIRFRLLSQGAKKLAIVEPSSPVSLVKGRNTVTIKLQAEAESAAGALDGQIAVDWDEAILRDAQAAPSKPDAGLRPATTIYFRATIYRRTLMEKFLSTAAWAAPMLLLILAVTTLILFRLRLTFKDLWGLIFHRQQLFGSLELEDGTRAIDLRAQSRRVVNLGELFTGLNANESDAQLSVEYREGRAKIRLTWLRGDVELNSIPLRGHAQLKGGNLVQVGKLRVVFREN